MVKTNKKKVLSIFIPIMGTISVCAIVVPLVCLATVHPHLKSSAFYREWKISLQELKDNKQYFVFTVMDDLTEDEIWSHLKYSWEYTITSDRDCKLELADNFTYDSSTKEGKIEMSMKTLDGDWPSVGNSISYNINFYFEDDSGDKVWKQTFTNNYWRVEN